MTDSDVSPAEMRARITGLTQAVAAIIAQLIAQGAADEGGIMRALDRCERDLRQMAQPTYASGQVGYLRDEIRKLLPMPRHPLDD